MSTDIAESTLPVQPRINVRQGTIWMLVSLLCFTANSLLLKYFATSRHIDPWVSMAFRFGIGLALTWMVFTPSGTLNLGRSFKSWLLASRGVFGGLGTAAYYFSIGHMGAGKATLVGNTWCVFSAVMAMIVLGEKLTRGKAAGIAITLGGLALLTGLAPGTLGTFGQWELVALVGALLAAAVVVMIRQLTATETSATIFASQCVYGLLLALPFAVRHAPHLDGMDVFLLCVASFCAAAGQLAMTEGFRFLTVAVGGAFQITLPVVISIGSIVLFAEPFSMVQVLGAVLILAGSFQTVRK
jgi:drug/metabolite transporter (DMT)-like permease